LEGGDVGLEFSAATAAVDEGGTGIPMDEL